MNFDDGRLFINMKLMEMFAAMGIPITQFKWGPKDRDVNAYPLVVFFGKKAFLVHFTEKEIRNADKNTSVIEKKFRHLIRRIARKLGWVR